MKTSNHHLPQALIVTTVAINALGIGLILPVMPDLLQQVGHVDIARAAAIGGLLSLAFAAMQVMFGPLLGGLSDQFGRRPVIIISLLANAFDYAILAISNLLWLFFVARLLSGIASATFSVANAVLADMAPPEKRAAHFGLTGAAFGVGFVLGPVAGGLLGELGPRAPFLAATLLCVSAAGLCWLFLPETLTTQNRRTLRLTDSIPLAAFLKLRRRMDIAPLVLVNFLDELSGLVYPAVWAYFTVARFGWGPSTVGLSLAAYGLCMVFIQGGLIRVLVSRLGEQGTSIFGLSAGIVGFLVLSRLESGAIAFLLTPLSAVRVVSDTALSGLLSRRVSDSEQGELQGILAGVSGVSTLIAIPLMTQIFALTNHPERINPWPGAPFAVAAVFSAMALTVLIFSLRRSVVRTPNLTRDQLTRDQLARDQPARDQPARDPEEVEL